MKYLFSIELAKIYRYLLVLILASFQAFAYAQTVDAKGEHELSIKAQGGDIAVARKIARENAEVDAIGQALKLRISVNMGDPKVRAAILDIRKQLSDNLKTSFRTEGDFLTARASLSVDSGQIFDLAKSLGLTSSTATAAAKVLFVIDEYFGVGTKLDPSAPTSTEISYSHDKSSSFDRSLKASASKSSSSSSASASREDVAVKASSSESIAASSDRRVSGSESESFAGSRQSAAAVSGSRGSAAASESASVAASRQSQLSASEKQSLAASSSSNFQGARSSASSSSRQAASASSSSIDQKDIGQQKDIVNYSFKQTFPDLNNAKPQDSSMIVAKLEQTIKPYGLSLVSERDFRVEGGRKLLISDIEKLSKFDEYLSKASKGNFSAKYIVYGTGKTHVEGKTATGNVACSGSIALQSANVDTGENLVSGTIAKRAEGSIDTNCRDNLAQAMATELAKIIGESAARDLQRTQTLGQSYLVTLYSRLAIPGRLKRDFKKALNSLANAPEDVQEGNTTEALAQWTVTAKGQFSSKLEEASYEISDKFEQAKELSYKKVGNKIFVCIEGKCPEAGEI